MDVKGIAMRLLEEEALYLKLKVINSHCPYILKVIIFYPLVTIRLMANQSTCFSVEISLVC